ncbi:MAG: divalent metal cation transporter, partial [Patescibacteria group bacterium]
MNKFKKFLKAIGPGFITGASDDDPSGIATYSQAGAQFGYGQLWTALFSFPFMTAVQEMCGRIGMVTGHGLSGVIRSHYSRKLLFVVITLVLIANIFNIGADLGAMAASGSLLVRVPFAVWIGVVTIVTILLEVLIPYRVYAKFLKYLTFTLFAYVLTAFIVKQDWHEVTLHTLVPQLAFTKEYFMSLVAILGTTISPYLFFWQADEEVEEEILHHKLRTPGKGIPKITNRDIREMRHDTILGMFFSNAVMFFIMLTSASTLGAHGILNISSASQAAEALRPLGGDVAFLLFAFGIIGTGLLAVPILAGSASYALSEGLQWKVGLSKTFSQAKGFYGIIIVATAIGFIMNFLNIPPFRMLYYAAILNGVCAPPL